MHGRTNGYWNAERGEVRRLGCTECHDPHNPRSPLMVPMKPLPEPNTLRMRPKRSDGHGAGAAERDPLQRVLRRMLGGDEAHPAKTSEQITVEDDKDGR